MSFFRFEALKLTGVSLAVLCCFGMPNTAAAESKIALVTHSSSEISTLSREQVVAIYLGKLRKLSGGVKVTPVDQVSSRPVRGIFLDHFIGKTESQMAAYWSRKVFTGKGLPPEALDGDGEVKRWLAEHPNSIGYINGSEVDETVQVLLSAP